MSYDVSIGGGCDCVDHWLNYTSNVAGMWDRAGAPLRDWGGREAGTLVPMLDKAIAELEGHPERYVEMEPDNGWGTLEGAVKFLKGIRTMCQNHPTEQLWVSR